MPTTILTVPDMRARLSVSGWLLTELAGGPWIIYGYKGEIPLCVMGKTRTEAWQNATDAGKASAPVVPPIDGKLAKTLA